MVRILIYLAAAMTLIACSEQPVEPELADTAEVQAFMADAAAVARGQAIFEGSCASFCHTMEPTAALDASFLFDCQWNHGSTDQDIFNTVTSGVVGTRMVGFGSNFPEGDNDLWKVIAYLRSKQQAC
ncbi:MAG: c-type cytochrome [Gammaproteobacteria bacterium]|nr:c-type cytochrome [Gammaproteobacteria bacterium]